MSSIYSLDAHKNLFLYTTDSLIYLRNSVGETLERAITLCNDYASHMTDVIHNNTLYFAYQNKQQDIILRSITDLNDLYKLSSQDTPDCSNPHLTVLNNRLILFYLVKNPLNDSYVIKNICPFATECNIHLPHSFSSQPVLHFLPLMNGLLLTIEFAGQEELLYIHNDGSLETMSTMESKLSEQIARLEATHTAKLQTMEQEYTTQLARTEALLTSQISTLKGELFQKNKMIESAKLQYNQLMDTAGKYRDEAIKWRSKFYRED